MAEKTTSTIDLVPPRRRVGEPEQVVIIGCGFAGYFAARRIARSLGHRAVVTVVSDTDGMLYQPLLPEVAVGALDPRTIMVPLAATLKRVHLVRGHATAIDLARRQVSVLDPAGHVKELRYDRLVLAAGGVTRMRDIPGLAEHAVGFKTIAQALYLRDLLLRRMEQANDEPDPETRAALLNFLIVGAGYSGTELVAQMARMSHRLLGRFPNLVAGDLQWLLLDAASNVMPELGLKLGLKAVGVLQALGVDIRLDTSIAEITDEHTVLTDGTHLGRAHVIWCAGVSASPLIAALGLPTTRGRVNVEADLCVPGYEGLYALGDAAAVPDITKVADGDGRYPLCPPTAQHAMRQARAAARNVVADVRGGSRRDYRHRDLGLVVDLGGRHAVARPLGIPLTGWPAKIVTRGYHVMALPTIKRKTRALLDWLLAGRTGDDVAFGFEPTSGTLAISEHRPAEHRAPALKKTIFLDAAHPGPRDRHP